MKRKNYLKSYFKEFGLIPAIIFIVAFIMLGFVVYKKPIMAASYTNAIAGALEVVLIGGAVLGLSKLKHENFGLNDFIRITFFVGSVAVAVFAAMGGATMPMIIYFVCAGVYLVEIILRNIFFQDLSTVSLYRNFFGALAYRFNPLLLLVLGMVLGVVFSVVAKTNVISHLESIDFKSLKYVFIGGAGAAVLLIILAGMDTDSDVTILDGLMAIMFVGSAYSIVTASNELGATAFKMVLLLLVASMGGLMIRAVFYNKNEVYDENRKKIRTYFKTVFNRFDIAISLLVAVILVLCLGIGFAVATQPSNGFYQFLNTLGTFGPTQAMVAECVGLGIILVLIVLICIFRRFTWTDVVKTDEILVFLLFGTGIAIPLLVAIAISGAFATVMGNMMLFVTLIVYTVVFVLALALQLFRIGKFDPMAAIIEAEQKKRIEDAQKQKAAEEAAAEENAEEEAPAEEEEEVFDPFALSEEDEAIYEAEYGKDETTEEETPAEEVVEEVAEEEAPAEEEEAVEEEAPAEEVVEEAVAEAAPAEDAEDADDSEEEEEAEDEDEEDAEELEDGEEVSEEPVEQTKEAGIVVQDFQIVDEDGTPKKIKRRFNTKMMFAPYESKEYYNEIKNYLMMYRAKGRCSSRCESFRYKGLVAKVALGGKSIKVFLALDPSYVDEYPKYHLKNVSDKKQYAEVPVMIKVRSERALKYFKELVDIMFANRLVKPKRNFEPTNYIPSLIPNGEAILATLGMSTDYLQDSMNVRGIPEEMPDDLIEYLPMIPGDDLEDEEVEANVYLDTLCNHFEDGDEVTIDVLKSLHIVTKGNVLRIRARGTLDRKLIIYAEKFDEDALKMLMCTNCTAVRIVR